MGGGANTPILRNSSGFLYSQNEIKNSNDENKNRLSQSGDQQEYIGSRQMISS
jgi:hypothetical protein